MTVVKLPTQQDRHPGDIESFDRLAVQQTPPTVLALVPAEERQGVVVDDLQTLARKGTPEPVLEALMGWPRGTIVEWRKAPPWPGLCGARWFGEAMAQASAHAEAELAATLHTRGRHDAKVAQWLLERRRPERWGQSSADVAQVVDRVVAAVTRAVPDVDPVVLRDALRSAAEGG